MERHYLTHGRRALEKVLPVNLLVTMKRRSVVQSDITYLEIAKISMYTILIAKLLVMIAKSPRVINFSSLILSPVFAILIITIIKNAHSLQNDRVS